MKKIIAGVGLLCSGTVFITVSMIITYLNIESVISWTYNIEKYLKAMNNAGFTLIFFAGIVMMVTGLIMIIQELIKGK